MSAVDPSNLRIAVIFRADLDAMTRGKSEGQYGHAVDYLVEIAEADNPELLRQYRQHSRLKLSMEVDGLQEIYAIAEKARKRGVPFFIVKDEGRTCFGEPTETCIGLGPMSKNDSNALTRKAKMRDMAEKEKAVDGDK